MLSDVILEIKGIEGEAQDKGFEKKINVSSVSTSMSNASSMGRGGGGGKGQASFQDFNFTKEVDAASHALQSACVKGDHLDEVKIHFRKSGGDKREYLTITLKEAFITHFSYSSSGDGSVHEQFAMAYTKIEYVYKQQDEKGKVSGGKIFNWDIKKGDV